MSLLITFSLQALEGIELHQTGRLPTDRSFGFLFVVVFSVLSVWGLYRGWQAAPALMMAAAVTLAVSLLKPALLAPFNRAWMKLAEVMHRFISPIVLGLIFFVIVTPFGLIRRTFGSDPLARKWNTDSASYWIARSPPGPPSRSFKNQY